MPSFASLFLRTRYVGVCMSVVFFFLSSLFSARGPPNKTFVAPGAVWNVQILLRWRGHMGALNLTDGFAIW